jgi:hypothetical protein
MRRFRPFRSFRLGFASFLLLAPFVLFDAMDIDGSGFQDPAEVSKFIRGASDDDEGKKGDPEDRAGGRLPASRGHSLAIVLLVLSAPPSLTRHRLARRGAHPHRAISPESARPDRGSDPARRPA